MLFSVGLGKHSAHEGEIDRCPALNSNSVHTQFPWRDVAIPSDFANNALMKGRTIDA